MNLFICILLLALILYCKDTLAISSKNLDSLLNTKNLFSNIISTRGGRLLSNDSLLDSLRSQLGDDETLYKIYRLYQRKYKKHRETNKAGIRGEMFKNRLMEIAEHNILFQEGKSTFQKGVNQFTDQVTDTGEAPLLPTLDFHYQKPNRSSKALKHQPTPWLPFSLIHNSRSTTNDNLDWRNYGAVSPVKNQGQCGACVMFASVAALESHNYLVQLGTSSNFNSGGGGTPTLSSRPLDLSEQELLDCAKEFPGYNGCKNNHMTTALEYFKQKGLSLERDYPYWDRVGKNCYSRYYYHPGKMDTYFRVEPSYDEEKLKEAVRDYGPVVTGIYMSDDLKQYSNGIYNEKCEDPNGVVHNVYQNHVVVIVGYGTEWVNLNSVGGYRKMDYWIVKNSYGANWGDRGYFRIERGRNLCLLGQESYFLYTRQSGIEHNRVD